MKQAYSYKGMTKDLAKSKKSSEYYYDAKNIRVLATDSETTLALTTIKGNELKFTLPSYSYYTTVYQPKLVHTATITNYIVAFVYYKTDVQSILRINTTDNSITTLIQGDLNISDTYNIESESFYENENLIKLYWVDGNNPMRYLNILKPTTNISLLDVCPAFKVSVPELEYSSWGGVHTSGMIQYCYNLVVKNGAQTKVSPRTPLIPLKKQTGGGEVNEIVGQINHIKIDNVDTKFDIIRVYAIKYTSYNQSPVVSLIAEESINKNSGKLITLRFVDDGNIIYNISEQELLFLGGENFVPSYIASKFNYLILGDIKENYFDISTDEYDTRAYRFRKNTLPNWQVSKIKNKDENYENIIINTNNQAVLQATGSLIPTKHDCINDLIEYREFTTTKTITNYISFPTPIYRYYYNEEPPVGNEGDINYYCGLSLSDAISYGEIRLTYGLTLYCPDADNIIYLNKTNYPNINFSFTYDLSTVVDLLLEIKNDLNIIIKDAQDLELINERYTFLLEDTEDRPGDLNYRKLSWRDYLSFVADNFILDISGEYITYEDVTTGNAVDERYVYKYNSSIYGATGTNIEVDITPVLSSETNNLLKSREIYRIAVEFYNNIGQYTEPKWICDIVVPDGNLNGYVNKLDIKFKNIGTLRNLGVVGWNILRVERTEADKTILMQGIVNPCIFQDYKIEIPNDDDLYNESYYDELGLQKANKTGEYSTKKFVKLPSPFMRNAADVVENEITTENIKAPWPTNIVINGFTGMTGSPKINKVKNGKCISYPVMGGDDRGDIGIGGIDIVNKYKQHVNYPFPEIFKKHIEDKVTAQESYQFTNMFQFYSPELLFLNPILGNNLQYTVIGKLNNGEPIIDSNGDVIGVTNCGVWGKQIATADANYKVSGVDWTDQNPDWSGDALNDIKEAFQWLGGTAADAVQFLLEEKANIVYKVGDTISDVRLSDHLHLFKDADKREGAELYRSVNEDSTIINYTKSVLHKSGFIGPSGGRSRRQNFYQYYRNYELDPSYSITHDYREVAGNPIIIGKGEAGKAYNDLTLSSDKYTFTNHLFTVITDSNTADPADTEDPIMCVNSAGNTCLNLVDSEEMPLETIFSYYNILGNSTPLVEIKRILENQYGGNTYEARSRNSYLRIGKYTALPSTNIEVTTSIISAGDIFVNRFKFLRILPNVAQVQNHRYTALTEIVEFPVESSINNSCRNDKSLNSWDDMWFPSYDDYHNYNRVYSQEPISNKNTATPFTFEQVKHSAVRILSTKVKTPGEIVDGWTDVLINEELNLNGQYGKLTKLIRNNDTLYFFQDNALGILMVQPRIQQVTSDGLGVELGTGQILYNYQYLSTASGSTNPKCIFTSPNFVYYIDVTNKTINRVSDRVEGLSDPAGLHAYMYNNILQSYDNSLSLVGIYDNINDEAYFTTPGFTIIFNESKNSFISFYDFKPKHYIKVPGKLFSCNDYTNIYQHDIGDYCNFYGTVYDSEITLFCNPNQFGPLKTRFDNIEFNAELRDNDTDVFYNENTNTYSLPIKSIEVTTDYQKTADTTLVWGSNIRRKFRNWSIVLPRAYDFVNNKETMDRMRGEWAYIKLTMDNTNNYNLVLHDIILNFA